MEGTTRAAFSNWYEVSNGSLYTIVSCLLPRSISQESEGESEEEKKREREKKGRYLKGSRPIQGIPRRSNTTPVYPLACRWSLLHSTITSATRPTNLFKLDDCPVTTVDFLGPFMLQQISKYLPLTRPLIQTFNNHFRFPSVSFLYKFSCLLNSANSRFEFLFQM